MDIQKEREAFEDWYIRNMDTNGDFEKISEQDSPYMDEHVNNSWSAWQAAKDESHKQAALYQSEINHLAQANQQWREKAAKAQAVPEGFVLVPKKATKNMLNAGYEAHDGFFSNGAVQDVYVAMIAASQEPK